LNIVCILLAMPFEEKEFQLVLSGTGGTNIDTKIDTKGVMD